MNTKQFLSDILDEFNKIDYVKPEDIPNIDLYMDQVTTFMDSQLATSKRHEDDKILTKTMINNYAKNDLLPPPEKKKYSKEHVLTLIFIYYFKSILSIKDIETVLKPLTEKYFSGNYDLVVLDEVIDAYNLGTIPKDQLLEMMDKRPEGTELVITGHQYGMDISALTDRADYVTKFVKEKHPFDLGMPCRKGIEE